MPRLDTLRGGWTEEQMDCWVDGLLGDGLMGGWTADSKWAEAPLWVQVSPRIWKGRPRRSVTGSCSHVQQLSTELSVGSRLVKALEAFRRLSRSI